MIHRFRATGLLAAVALAAAPAVAQPAPDAVYAVRRSPTSFTYVVAAPSSDRAEALVRQLAAAPALFEGFLPAALTRKIDPGGAGRWIAGFVRRRRSVQVKPMPFVGLLLSLRRLQPLRPEAGRDARRLFSASIRVRLQGVRSP